MVSFGDMIDKAAIEKEVTHMLKQFGKDLARVSGDAEGSVRPVPKTSHGFRHEGKAPASDEAFSERMFSNAKKKSGKHIIAEKGNW